MFWFPDQITSRWRTAEHVNISGFVKILLINVTCAVCEWWLNDWEMLFERRIFFFRIRMIKPSTQPRHIVCMFRYPCKQETECTQRILILQNSWIVLASYSSPSLALRVYPQWLSGGSVLHTASEVCSSRTFGTRERFMCFWCHIHK
jgi:hypothetical protein